MSLRKSRTREVERVLNRELVQAENPEKRRKKVAPAKSEETQ